MHVKKHLLFYGPPGSGKSYATREYTNCIYITPDIFRNTLELRNLLQELCRIKRHMNTTCIIDNADILSKDAQYIIVDAMDILCNYTFIIISNKITHYIDTLKLRCDIQYFKPINQERNNLTCYANGDHTIISTYLSVKDYYIHNTILEEHKNSINAYIGNCNPYNLLETYTILLELCINNGYSVRQLQYAFNNNHGDVLFNDTECESLKIELSKFLLHCIQVKQP